MNDQLDVHLEDTELLAEVELTTNLIIAASDSADPLTEDEIDDLLGVRQGVRPFPQQARGDHR